MNLKDYLHKENITGKAFAEKINVNKGILYRILNRNKRNGRVIGLSLEIAVAIEEATNGEVTCRDSYYYLVKKP